MVTAWPGVIVAGASVTNDALANELIPRTKTNANNFFITISLSFLLLQENLYNEVFL